MRTEARESSAWPICDDHVLYEHHYQFRQFFIRLFLLGPCANMGQYRDCQKRIRQWARLTCPLSTIALSTPTTTEMIDHPVGRTRKRLVARPPNSDSAQDFAQDALGSALVGARSSMEERQKGVAESEPFRAQLCSPHPLRFEPPG